MPPPVRPRRSVLYMPGANGRALEKAKTLPADGLIFDLEDAVAPAAKALARQMVCGAVGSGAYGRRERIVRVNGLSTPWGHDDLQAVARCGADAVLLPKIESGAMVRQAVDLLTSYGAPDALAIWCMMETPLGVLHAAEIAASSTRLGALVLGTSDLAKDLHAQHTPDRLPFLTSFGLCILAARAYGLAVLDGVHLDLQDEAGFRAACCQAVALGFDGKTLIHPNTLAVANEVFAPTASDVAEAQAIIAVHAHAVAQGRGVVLLHGRLIENLHVDNAHRIIALADAIAELEQGNAEA